GISTITIAAPKGITGSPEALYTVEVNGPPAISTYDWTNSVDQSANVSEGASSGWVESQKDLAGSSQIQLTTVSSLGSGTYSISGNALVTLVPRGTAQGGVTLTIAF